MTFIYDIVFLLFSLLYFPYLLIKGKWHDGFKTRLGRFEEGLVHALRHDKNIWIHAVSVGEVLAVLPLVQSLKESFSDYRIVFSTVTPTGNKLAKEKLGDYCKVIYAPLDLSWIVQKYIAVIKPKMYIAAETEIWPNLYTELAQNNVPIIQINGRISDKAFGGYKRFKFLIKKVLDCVALFCMQSDIYADRIEILGANPNKIHVVGNLKFDATGDVTNGESDAFQYLRDEQVVIAGSTHPGEEEIILSVYKRLMSDFPDLRLVIAPRHIERTEDICEVIEQRGFKPVQLSESFGQRLELKNVLVVDTIGQLRSLYAVGTIIFVGKSLVGRGGQNIIEPALYGKPIIVGPNTENFADTVRIFQKENALFEVYGADELYAQIRDLLRNPDMIAKAAESTQKVVESHRGATNKTVDLIQKVLLKV